MSVREELIERAKDVAAKLGKKTISRSEFARESGISGNQIYQHFDGWRELCELAGLQPHLQNVRLDDDEIFSAMRDTFIELGGITARHRFDHSYPYSVDVFKKRGMTWRTALVAFRKWCEQKAPDFPFLTELPDEKTAAAPPADTSDEQRSAPAVLWQPSTGQIYGDLLNFRGLQHAPVDEQGVVFLFGMVARELGFLVERVQTAYPDCDAKRRIGQNRWQRTRIEFEYKSRSFRDHGHDPRGCGLVICWEHNWPECPVKVLELRDAIKHLPS